MEVYDYNYPIFFYMADYKGWVISCCTMLYVDFYPSTSIHPIQSSIYLEVLPTGDDSKTEGDLQSQWVHKADPWGKGDAGIHWKMRCEM